MTANRDKAYDAAFIAVTISVNYLNSAIKWRTLAEKSRTENRDVSDAELDAQMAENEALLNKILGQ